MITFSKLEKKGNIGNQMFQIASTIGIALENNQEYCFPKWSFNSYFENQLPVLENQEFVPYHEENFHFKPIFFDENNYDLEGWFQSELYFDLEKTKFFFKFKSNFIQDLQAKYHDLFSKKTILISIRRGDFVENKDYFQLPINYYLNALIENFKDWKNCNLLILSDDINYCKFHFSFLENAFFGENLNAIEQLALSSLCDDFIISNSTFSWWCAWLGEKKDSKIIRPLQNFSIAKNKSSSDHNYFPERWILFNHLEKKIDLGNTSILLFKSNLILEKYLYDNFHFTNDIYFFDNKTKSLKMKNKVVLLIDDFIIPPFCIYKAIKNKKDTAFYLKGTTLNISKFWDRQKFYGQLDFGLFSSLLNINNNLRSNRILFKKTSNFEIQNLDFKCTKTSNKEFDIFFTFAGKTKGFFECKYYLSQLKKNGIFKLKNILKIVIGYKKK
jgi:hypothetical protein